MKIEYYGLGSDLKEIMCRKFSEDEEELYVFENSSSFLEIKRDYFRASGLLFKKFRLMNIYDFYEKLLITDKIVIKEEKQAVFFYNALTERLKKELKIGSYYDVIDIAYNFYDLFSELQEYSVDYSDRKSLGLERWQEGIFEALAEINGIIEKKVMEKGLILPYMLRKVENIGEDFIRKYRKIYFINKVRFTPFEREMIKVIEEKGVEIVILLQLSQEDFDGDRLRIREGFSLSSQNRSLQEKDVNIEIHEYESSLSQLLGTIKRLKFLEKNENSGNNQGEKERRQYRIYDLLGEEVKDEDYHLLNQERIRYNLEVTMSRTGIYKILDLLYNILGNVRTVHKRDKGKIYLFRIKDFYKAYKSDDFLKVFNLKRSYRFFQNLVSNSYKYISRELLRSLVLEHEEGEGNDREPMAKREEALLIMEFVERLEKILSFSSLKEYGDFLEKLFNESKERDPKVRDKYFEALSEMLVLERLDFDDLWHGFFRKGEASAGLLKLFLKYLDKKAVSLDLEEISEEEDYSLCSINMFRQISETVKENLILINIQDPFPKVTVNNFLFTKIQRAKMGLPLSDDMKQPEIFKFYNNILSGKKVYLSYVKNSDEKSDSAGVLEEIRLKYGIEPIREEVGERDELLFIRKYFGSCLPDSSGKGKMQIGKFQKSKLMKNREMLDKENLSLGYYAFEKMRDFEYGFYLEKMIGDCEEEDVEDRINAMMFGNIIHSMYEKLVMRNREGLTDADYEVSRGEIEEILAEVLHSYEYKVPKEYMAFYEKISFKELVASAIKFINKLKEELNYVEDAVITSEERIKVKSEKEIYRKVFINGVADLHIKGRNEEILVDYKSGNLEKRHIAKALEQLDYYSVMIGEKGKPDIKKYIVDTWNGTIIKDDRKSEDAILTEDDIIKLLKRYYGERSYNLGEKKDYFYNKYRDICRREDELADE